MHQSCSTRVRATAAVGTVVAMITMASAFGVGAASAMADDTQVTSPATPTASPSVEPTAAPRAVTPAATTAGTVAISGTATTWHTLRADTAGWPAGTTFTYQWTLSGPVVGTRVIEGATSDTYVLGHPDASNDLSVAVTGTAPGEDPTTVSSPLVHVEPNAESTFTGAGVLAIDAAAGTAFSIPIQALSGDQGGLRYGASSSFDGPIDASTLPAGVTLSSDGVLSGSTTQAQTLDFWVLVRTAQEPAGAPGQHVELRVGLAAGDQVYAGVVDDDPSEYRSWRVSADGTTSFSSSPEVLVTDPSRPVTSTVGGGVTVNAGRVDRYGNMLPYPVLDNDWTSSVASDDLTEYDPGTSVRFSEPGEHVLTGTTVDGRTISVTVQVAAASPAAVPTVATRVSGTGTTGADRLAYTGVDTTGPLAWALGLLGAGAALLVYRVRRRRA